MIDELIQLNDDFRIFCLWCGIEIRRDASEDSFGTCLDCFYRSVWDQLNAQRPLTPNQFASDRYPSGDHLTTFLIL
ncbi:MAG: hypothetical protein ACRD8U_13130 [Pyrinomonadaceae bacterium]